MPIWLILLLVAPFVGSFLGVIILRQDRTALVGRSHCDACGHVLSWIDLVPLVSWSALGRRCRFCGKSLSWFYPGIELAAVIPVVWAASEAPGRLQLASAVLGWWLLALGVIDWRTKRLPDPLTYGLVVLGLVTTYLFDRQGLADHLVGAIAGLVVLWLIAVTYHALRLRQGLGLGDAKLLAGLGAYVSWWGLPTVILLAAIFGILYALARATWTRSLDAQERIAFGPFLALSGWIVWLYGPLLPSP